MAPLLVGVAATISPWRMLPVDMEKPIAVDLATIAVTVPLAVALPSEVSDDGQCGASYATLLLSLGAVVLAVHQWPMLVPRLTA